MELYRVEAESKLAYSSWLIMADSPEDAVAKFNDGYNGQLVASKAHRFYIEYGEAVRIAVSFKE